VRFLVLFFGLFELDLVDFDAVFGVREVRVEGEGVGGGDVFAFGVFGEGTEFGAGEGLEGAFYFVFGWESVLVLWALQCMFDVSLYLRKPLSVKICE
jgi:hypothetical protein